jgi:F0F1-type ATP synthase assembly protein I
MIRKKGFLAKIVFLKALSVRHFISLLSGGLSAKLKNALLIGIACVKKLEAKNDAHV